MKAQKLFLWLAAAAGYVGIGMLLGYALGDQTINTALWLGILLVIGGAILLGMGISGGRRGGPDSDDRPVSSSGNITDLPKSE